MPKLTIGKHTINRLFKIIKNIFLLFIILSCLYVIIGIVFSKHIDVNSYTIKADISSTIRIVHITDLHNAEIGSANEKLIKTIRDQHPDLIFMTGDMINRDDPDLSVIISLIQNLSDIAPVYYGYGNHETAWQETHNSELYQGITAAGANVVQDSYVDLDMKGNSLRIGGVMNYYRAWHMLEIENTIIQQEEEFANAFENTDRYKILLNHIPTSFTDWGHMNDYPVDLVFSGHYHGGMIRIPVLDQGLYAPYVGYFPPYTKGVFSGIYTTCVQSVGLGTEYSIPRLFNPPEVVVVDLVPN